MSSFDQKLQLINHMNSLFDEGLLNEQFHQAEILRESHRNNSHFVAQFIATFCDGTQKLLADVDDILKEETVDFSQMYHIVCKIRGSTSMMGAYNMKNAIRPLIQYCKENDKDRCMEVLQGIKHEFQHTRDKLETIVKLEKNIRRDGKN